MDFLRSVQNFFLAQPVLSLALAAALVAWFLPRSKPSARQRAQIEDYFRSLDVRILKVDRSDFRDPGKFNYGGKGQTAPGYFAVWTQDSEGITRRCVLVVYGPPTPETMMLRSKVVTSGTVEG